MTTVHRSISNIFMNSQGQASLWLFPVAAILIMDKAIWCYTILCNILYFLNVNVYDQIQSCTSLMTFIISWVKLHYFLVSTEIQHWQYTILISVH